MAVTIDELTRVAKEKNVDVAPLLMMGYSPDEIHEALKVYQPSRGIVGEFLSGLGAGTVALGRSLGNILSALPITEELGETIKSKAEEALQSELLRPPTEAGFVSKASRVVGEMAPVIAAALLTRNPYVLPAFFGASTAAEIGKEKGWERGVPAGLAEAALFTLLPEVSSIGGKVAEKVLPEAVMRALSKVPAPAKRAVALPIVTTGTDIIHQLGRGEEVALPSAEDLAAQYLAGLLLETPIWALQRKAGAGKVSEEEEPVYDLEDVAPAGELPPAFTARAAIAPESSLARRIRAEEYLRRYYGGEVAPVSSDVIELGGVPVPVEEAKPAEAPKKGKKGKKEKEVPNIVLDLTPTEEAAPVTTELPKEEALPVTEEKKAVESKAEEKGVPKIELDLTSAEEEVIPAEELIIPSELPKGEALPATEEALPETKTEEESLVIPETVLAKGKKEAKKARGKAKEAKKGVVEGELPSLSHSDVIASLAKNDIADLVGSAVQSKLEELRSFEQIPKKSDISEGLRGSEEEAEAAKAKIERYSGEDRFVGKGIIGISAIDNVISNLGALYSKWMAQLSDPSVINKALSFGDYVKSELDKFEAEKGTSAEIAKAHLERAVGTLDESELLSIGKLGYLLKTAKILDPAEARELIPVTSEAFRKLALESDSFRKAAASQLLSKEGASLAPPAESNIKVSPMMYGRIAYLISSALGLKSSSDLVKEIKSVLKTGGGVDVLAERVSTDLLREGLPPDHSEVGLVIEENRAKFRDQLAAVAEDIVNAYKGNKKAFETGWKEAKKDAELKRKLSDLNEAFSTIVEDVSESHLRAKEAEAQERMSPSEKRAGGIKSFIRGLVVGDVDIPFRGVLGVAYEAIRRNLGDYFLKYAEQVADSFKTSGAKDAYSHAFNAYKRIAEKTTTLRYSLSLTDENIAKLADVIASGWARGKENIDALRQSMADRMKAIIEKNPSLSLDAFSVPIQRKGAETDVAIIGIPRILLTESKEWKEGAPKKISERISELRERFEEARKEGLAPQMSDFLSPTSSDKVYIVLPYELVRDAAKLSKVSNLSEELSKLGFEKSDLELPSVLNNAVKYLTLGEREHFVHPRATVTKETLTPVRMFEAAVHSFLKANSINPFDLTEDQAYIVRKLYDYSSLVPAINLVDRFRFESIDSVSALNDLKKSIEAHQKIPQTMKDVVSNAIDATLRERRVTIFDALIKIKDALNKVPETKEGIQTADVFSAVIDALETKGFIDKGEADQLRFFNYNFKLVDSVKAILDNPEALAQDPTKIHEIGSYIISRVIGEEYGLNVLGDKDAVVKAFNRVGAPFLGMVDHFARIISVVPHSLNTKDVASTIGHEAFHVLWDRFGDIEKNVLLRKYGNIERAADAFGDYIANKIAPPNSAIRRIFDKVKSFIDKIVNIFAGYGFRSAQEIFERAWLSEYVRQGKPIEEIPADIAEHSFDVIRRYDFKLFDKFAAVNEEKVENALKDGWDAMKDVWKTVRAESPRFFRNFILPIYNDTLKLVYRQAKEASYKANTYAIGQYSKIMQFLTSIKKERPSEFKIINELAVELDKVGAPLYATSAKDFDKLFNDVAKRLGIDVGSVNKERVIDALHRLKRDKFDPDFRMQMSISYRYRRIWFDRVSGDAAATLYADPRYRHVIKEKLKVAMNALDEYLLNGLFNPHAPLDYYRKTADRTDFDKYPSFTFPENIKRGRIPVSMLKQVASALDDIVGGSEERHIMEAANNLSSYVKTLADSLNRYVDNVLELPNIYYMPRVRNGGNSFIAISKRVYDSEGNFKGYSTVYYWDTPKRILETRERFELLRELKRIEKEVVPNFEGNVEFLNLDDPNLRREFNRRGGSVTGYARYKADFRPDYVILYGRKGKLSEGIFDKLSQLEALQLVNHLLAKTPEKAKDILDALEGSIMEEWADKSYALARSLTRKKIEVTEGYKKDLSEILDEHNTAMTSHFGNAEFNFLMYNLRNSAEFNRRIADPATKELIERYVDMVTAPANKLSKAMFATRNVVTLWYLGWRLASSFYNMLQPYIMFLPEYAEAIRNLSGYYYSELRGAKRAYAKQFPYHTALATAYKEYVSTFKKYFPFMNLMMKKGVYTPIMDQGNMALVMFHPERLDAVSDAELAKIKFTREEASKVINYLSKLETDGVLESSILNMIRLEAGGTFGKLSRSIVDKSMLVFRLTENIGRIMGALTAREGLLSRKGVDPIESNEDLGLVRHLIEKTFGDYSRINRLHWTNPSRISGALATPMMALQGYNLHLMSFLAEAIGKRELGKFATVLATIALFGGITAPLNPILTALETVTGQPIRYNIRKFFGDKDDDLSKLMLGGLFAPIGIDLSVPMRVEIPFLPEKFSVEGIADAYFGVYGSLFERWNRGVDYLSAGDYLAALVNFAPVGISAPLKAWDIQKYGLRSKWSKPIIDPETGERVTLNNPMSAVFMALGFNPLEISSVQEKRYLLTKISEKFKREKTKIFSRYRRAIDDGDLESLHDLFSKIVEFNEKAIEYAPLVSPITDKGLKAALRVEPDKALMVE